MDERMDDIGAVMDAVGSARAAMFGISEGGTLSLLFADAHPERTRRAGAVRLVGPPPRRSRLSVRAVGGASSRTSSNGMERAWATGEWWDGGRAERVRRRSGTARGGRAICAWRRARRWRRT